MDALAIEQNLYCFFIFDAFSCQEAPNIMN